MCSQAGGEIIRLLTAFTWEECNTACESVEGCTRQTAVIVNVIIIVIVILIDAVIVIAQGGPGKTTFGQGNPGKITIVGLATTAQVRLTGPGTGQGWTM